MNNAPKGKISSTGIVVEAITGILCFVCQLTAETKEIVLAYLAGKMRMNRIRVLVGDKVELEQDPYGGKARIIRRT